MTKEGYFYIGTIVRKYSFKGELLIKIDSDDPESYINLDSVFIELKTGLVPFFIQKCQLHKSALLRIKFNEVNNEFDADSLMKKDLYLPIDLLPPLKGKKFYFHEVIGFSLIEDGLLIGKIERIQDGGLQALFQVKKSDGKLALIPVHDDFILEVNRDLKRIIVKLPGGLINLQD